MTKVLPRTSVSPPSFLSLSETSTRSRYHALASGFTLIEMIATISVLAIVSAISVPALQGVTSASSLSVGAREFSNLLTQARNEAISRHTLVRLAVETSGHDSALRKSTLFYWDDYSQEFVQFTTWHEIAEGVIFETSDPAYLRNAVYADMDGASIRGDFVLDTNNSDNEDMHPHGGTLRVIEFLPSGAVRVPGGNGRNAIFVLAPGFSDSTGKVIRHEATAITNWAQINVDTLTGRVRIYRP